MTQLFPTLLLSIDRKKLIQIIFFCFCCSETVFRHLTKRNECASFAHDPCMRKPAAMSILTLVKA